MIVNSIISIDIADNFTGKEDCWRSGEFTRGSSGIEKRIVVFAELDGEDFKLHSFAIYKNNKIIFDSIYQAQEDYEDDDSYVCFVDTIRHAYGMPSWRTTPQTEFEVWDFIENATSWAEPASCLGNITVEYISEQETDTITVDLNEVSPSIAYAYVSRIVSSCPPIKADSSVTFSDILNNLTDSLGVQNKEFGVSVLFFRDEEDPTAQTESSNVNPGDNMTQTIPTEGAISANGDSITVSFCEIDEATFTKLKKGMTPSKRAKLWGSLDGDSFSGALSIPRVFLGVGTKFYDLPADEGQVEEAEDIINFEPGKFYWVSCLRGTGSFSTDQIDAFDLEQLEIWKSTYFMPDKTTLTLFDFVYPDTDFEFEVNTQNFDFEETDYLFDDKGNRFEI